ncbi:hypothetical protein CXB51_027309 [Gossypium anomalum]|uniref:Aminotransferase-like plant mobile domain-containing protein n=1 Tax=Gossypium anomalum TaxID=47600 RepID=A0A8J6CWA9_9ROSI|nr:hypothetical protein CXB51_027309 [Gossypium anomalum]
MAEKLIYLDNKHISVDQMTMSVDRVLQCYIRNMPGPPSSLIENYLRERWRPETYTFHLPCGECTITLEDVHLQLGLPVDGYAVTGSASSADWGAVCYELLGAIPDNINGGRIEMGWLRTHSRSRIMIRLNSKEYDMLVTASELSWGSAVLATLYKEMCGATRPNKAKIGDCLSLLQSWAWFRFPFLRPRVDHPYTFPLIKRWNHSASYVRIPTSLENIRLVLDQRSEAQFQWTLYEDPAIPGVIPDEFLQNPNAWHVKVTLVNYATVEMHQSDRVLRQFGFRQPIPVAPEVFDDEHKVHLWQLHTDWPRYWVHGKPYLLSEDERRRQIRAQRERRGPLNPRRMDDDADPSTAPTQSADPSTAPTQLTGPIVQPTSPTSQPFQVTLCAYSSPYIYPNPYMFPFFSPIAGWNPWPSSSLFPITLSQPQLYRPSSHEGSHDPPSGSSSFYQSPLPHGIQTPSPSVMQTPPQSLFYQGEPPSQHPQPDPLPEEPQPPPEAGQRRNPARTRRRPPCGTNFDRYEY